MEQAAPLADLFVTATGNINVVDRQHFEKMKDGAIMANSGHFDAEVNIKALARWPAKAAARCGRLLRSSRSRGQAVDRAWRGPAINLAAAEGHPASVMDMSFANQALGAGYIVREGKNSSRASTACRGRSITKSRGSSSSAWASKSTNSPRSKRVTSLPGTTVGSIWSNVRDRRSQVSGDREWDRRSARRSDRFSPPNR